jgi:hypothetical protein
MAASTAASMVLSGLLENTAYNFYFIAKDTAGNVQNAFSTVPFSTFGLTRTATGLGVTVSFAGGNANCGYADTRFSTADSLAASGSIRNTTPTTSAVPSGLVFSNGMFGFVTNNCGYGATLTFTATYPQPLAPNAVFYKFGPTPGNATPHWYTHPFTVTGSHTLTYSVTDGGAGDDDGVVNGIIVDDGGPGIPVPVGLEQIPALSEWALALLALLLAGLASRVVMLREVER